MDLFKGAKNIMDGVIGGAVAAINDQQKERKSEELKKAVTLVKEASKEAGHCLCCGCKDSWEMERERKKTTEGE